MSSIERYNTPNFGWQRAFLLKLDLRYLLIFSCCFYELNLLVIKSAVS